MLELFNPSVFGNRTRVASVASLEKLRSPHSKSLGNFSSRLLRIRVLDGLELDENVVLGNGVLGRDLDGLDFALFGGIGYEFPFGLGLEMRYNQGFIDIFGYDSQDDYEDFEWDELYLNSYFQIGATYKFDF